VTPDPGHFQGKYDASPDPYRLADRWYEARKYTISIALLPAQRYSSAFEPGCSTGVLTARLASRCDRLLVCDAIPHAVESARRVIPDEWPEESFDLIMRRAVHWRHCAPDHPRTGDKVHQILAGDSRLARLARYRDPEP
jgi:Nodulation protein S (NodS)